MNWDEIEGNWKQLKGKVQQQWGKLTDDDFDKINGRRNELVGKIQERYGRARRSSKKKFKSFAAVATSDIVRPASLCCSTVSG